MGNYLEHLIFALFLNFFLYLIMLNSLQINFSISLSTYILIVSAISSLIPDIDTKHSRINRHLRALISIFFSFLIFYLVKYPVELKFLALILAIPLLYILMGFVPFRHRGFTHSVGFGIIMSMIFGIISIYLFNSSLPIFFSFSAFISHLLLDGVLK